MRSNIIEEADGLKGANPLFDVGQIKVRTEAFLETMVSAITA